MWTAEAAVERCTSLVYIFFFKYFFLIYVYILKRKEEKKKCAGVQCRHAYVHVPMHLHHYVLQYIYLNAWHSLRKSNVDDYELTLYPFYDIHVLCYGEKKKKKRESTEIMTLAMTEACTHDFLGTKFVLDYRTRQSLVGRDIILTYVHRRLHT